MQVDRLITLLQHGKPVLSRVDRINAAVAVEGVTDNKALDNAVYEQLAAGEIFQHEYLIAGVRLRVKLVPVKARNHAGCQADQAIAAKIKNDSLSRSPADSMRRPAHV